MDYICKKEEMCCGCMGCRSACPYDAIEIQTSKDGFFYPLINKQKCKNCGICREVCAMSHPQKETNKQRIYAFKRSRKKQCESQSGGAFSALAESILEKGGVVYGVVFDDIYARYKRITKLKELKGIKGSKYVQAISGDTFRKVEKDLRSGEVVLYSGTPCYVDGLKQYLEKKNINCQKLYTCDLVCHGVPSPKIFRDYYELTCKEYRKKIKKYNFRDKLVSGWNGHVTSFEMAGKKIISTNWVNIFYSHYCLRKSCYLCPYASHHRVGNITVGDYWGIEKKHPDFVDGNGVSLLIINDEKGESLFQDTQKMGDYIETSLKDCLQHNLQEPTKKPENYKEFWDDYYKEDCFEKVITKYCKYNVKSDWKYINRSSIIYRIGSRLKKKLLGNGR